MPTYEYTCKVCSDSVYTTFRPIEERDKPVVCQDCGNFMVRSITSPPIHFKGAGFYKTGDFYTTDKGKNRP